MHVLSDQSRVCVNDGGCFVGNVHTDLNRHFKPIVMAANHSNKSAISSENISDIVHTYPNKVFRPAFDKDDQNTECVERGAKVLGTVHTDPNKKFRCILEVADAKNESVNVGGKVLHGTNTYLNTNLSPVLGKSDQNNKHRVCGENRLDLGHTYPNRIPRLAFVTADKSNKYVNPNQNFKSDHDKSDQNVLANIHTHPNRIGRFVLDKANRNKVFTHDDDGESCSNSVHTDPNKEVRPQIDIANCGHDKFLHSLLFQGGSTFCSPVQTCESFNLCKSQSKFDFGFIPLTDPILPMDSNTAANDDVSLLELYGQVKAKNAPNFLGARIPLISPLNVSKWEEYLDTYWDKQLLQFSSVTSHIG